MISLAKACIIAPFSASQCFTTYLCVYYTNRYFYLLDTVSRLRLIANY